MVRNVNASSRRVRRKSRNCRAWLNGREVTNRCFYADSRRGIVRLFLHDSGGHCYVDPATMKPAQIERRGHVRIKDAA